MELRKLTALVIFIASYLPLSMILLVQNIDNNLISKSFCNPFDLQNITCHIPLKNPLLSIGFFLTCVFCLAVTLIAISIKKPTQNISIKESKHIPTDLMNYVLPYVVSFMSIDYSETSKFLGFIIFLLWLFWITYKSGQIILNPVLVAFGWKLYEIRYTFHGSTNELSGTALCKTEPLPPNSFFAESIQDVTIIKE